MPQVQEPLAGVCQHCHVYGIRMAGKAPICNEPNLQSYLELVRFPQGYSQSGASYDAKRLLVTLRGRTYVPLISFLGLRRVLVSRPCDLRVRQCP